MNEEKLKEMFGNNEVVEIEASQFRAIARVRNIQGDRIHVAVESGYLPWIDDPCAIRSVSNGANFDARIVHASGTTALLEILDVAHGSSANLAPIRDTNPEF